MYITRTTELLQIVNDSAREVDVSAVWEDTEKTTSGSGPSSVETGSTLAAVATTNVTTIVPATKPKGATRKILFLSLKAPIANVGPVTVRLQQTDGTTIIDLLSVPLAPGDNRIFVADVGWDFIPASGVSPTTADLVQEFIDALSEALS